MTTRIDNHCVVVAAVFVVVSVVVVVSAVVVVSVVVVVVSVDDLYYDSYYDLQM